MSRTFLKEIIDYLQKNHLTEAMLGMRVIKADKDIYSGLTLNTAEVKNGAGERNRTPDRLITNQLLYLLSYASAIHSRRAL
jgi:hypothetical protein